MWCAQTRRVVLRQLAALLAAGAAAPAAGATAAKPPLTFGVFPFLPALELGRQFGPFATAFATIVGGPVDLRTKAGFPDFRRQLLDGHYDIALLHPFLFSDAIEVQDYRALGRLRENLAALIVAREDQPLERFADLRGAVLAVPPRLSAVARLVEEELREAGLDGPDGVQLAYHRTKAACLHAVVNQSAMACALPGFALGQVAAYDPIVLEPKFSTRSIPGILLAAHGRLGDPLIDRLRGAVLGWCDDPDGRAMLAALSWNGFVQVAPGEYRTAGLRLPVDG